MTPFREGDWVRVDHFGPHYAVVLRALGSHCVIVYATSTRRLEHKHILVEPDSADARRLGLTLSTYLYANNCIPVRSGKLSSERKRCPADLYLRLRELCEPQLARLEHLQTAELDELALSTAQRGADRKPR